MASPGVITSPTFRAAQPGDETAATALINSAYRGDSSTLGWTTEAHILKGRRVDEAGLAKLMAEPDSLILLCFQVDDLIGSVHLQRLTDDKGYLGMFVVRPDLQGRGFGRSFMREAEMTARRLLSAKILGLFPPAPKPANGATCLTAIGRSACKTDPLLYSRSPPL